MEDRAALERTPVADTGSRPRLFPTPASRLPPATTDPRSVGPTSLVQLVSPSPLPATGLRSLLSGVAQLGGLPQAPEVSHGPSEAQHEPLPPAVEGPETQHEPLPPAVEGPEAQHEHVAAAADREEDREQLRQEAGIPEEEEDFPVPAFDPSCVSEEEEEEGDACPLTPGLETALRSAAEALRQVAGTPSLASPARFQSAAQPPALCFPTCFRCPAKGRSELGREIRHCPQPCRISPGMPTWVPDRVLDQRSRRIRLLLSPPPGGASVSGSIVVFMFRFLPMFVKHGLVSSAWRPRPSWPLLRLELRTDCARGREGGPGASLARRVIAPPPALTRAPQSRPIQRRRLSSWT